MKIDTSNWRWFFLFAALEAGAALLVLFLVPHQGGSFSLTRLAMFGILLGFFILWMYFFARHPARWEFLIRHRSPRFRLCFAVALGLSLFLLRYLDPDRYLPYYQRLAPILFYLLVLALQFSVFTLISLYGLHRGNNPQFAPVFKSSLVALCIALAFCVLWRSPILDLLKIRPIGANPVYRCSDGRWPLQFSLVERY